MPKKHKAPSIKPTPAAHPSLESTRSTSGHGKTTDPGSVNDILQQMRNASSTSKGAGSRQTVLAPRTVHPSLRNILELPETPPPRPRPATTRHLIGQRRLRRTPGPPPPLSWGTPNSALCEDADSAGKNIWKRRSVKFGRRLGRLPGATLPSQDSLLHTALHAMATPVVVYLCLYGHPSMGVNMKGLEPLFMTQGQESSPGDRTEVTRLDLGFSLGYWLNIKQLSKELRGNIPSNKGNAPVPTSWEEEADSETATPSPYDSGKLDLPAFNNLRYLSLASPAPDSASWVSVLKLLSHLPTLTHLSLAYWPTPTLKPNSLTASVSHPKHKQLSFQYGGSDTYSSYENNWIEASIVLAKLSRTTYGLKWLDLEGCHEWIPALCWDGVDIYGKSYDVTGPEWNGSWRGIEWIGLGPGWAPEIPSQDSISVKDGDEDIELRRGDAFRKDQELFERAAERIKDVGKRIQMIRREGRGKWIHYSDGSERRDLGQRV
ncbi:hypothetical protein FQN49_001683 [Arthroderma sp. PD_2]|nr:hypothetical protein FQN49_001683 [Arthroderma sp. PD_2]